MNLIGKNKQQCWIEGHQKKSKGKAKLLIFEFVVIKVKLLEPIM